eukprot:6185443-Pleurochrysis_carterae.AAC.3
MLIIYIFIHNANKYSIATTLFKKVCKNNLAASHWRCKLSSVTVSHAGSMSSSLRAPKRQAQGKGHAVQNEVRKIAYLRNEYNCATFAWKGVASLGV